MSEFSCLEQAQCLGPCCATTGSSTDAGDEDGGEGVCQCTDTQVFWRKKIIILF